MEHPDRSTFRGPAPPGPNRSAACAAPWHGTARLDWPAPSTDQPRPCRSRRRRASSAPGAEWFAVGFLSLKEISAETAPYQTLDLGHMSNIDAAAGKGSG